MESRRYQGSGGEGRPWILGRGCCRFSPALGRIGVSILAPGLRVR
jgi:hypothetical protein